MNRFQPRILCRTGKSDNPFNRNLIKQQLRSTTTATLSSDCLFSVAQDQTSLANALNVSANARLVTLGTQIHGQLIKSGFSNDIFSLNNLIRMYSKCGYLYNGLRVFDQMPARNIVSWTLIISGAAENGDFEVGFQAFLEMIRVGLMPNQFTFGSVLRICTLCSSRGTYAMSLCVHCFAWKIGIDKNPFVASSLLHMYSKFSEIEAAEMIFEESVKSSAADVGFWNAMIGGYAQCGYGVEAVKVSSLMHSQGIRMDEYTFINALSGCSILGNLHHGKQIHGSIVIRGMVQITSVMNSLLDMYFKSGEKGIGLELFNSMKDKDVVTWNTIFSGFSQELNAREIVDLFLDFMLSGLKPDSITFSTLVKLCGELRDWWLGLQFYCLAIQSGYGEDSLVASSMISMLSRCELIDMARLMYDTLPSKSSKNLNEMMSGYNYLSLETEALRLLHDVLAKGNEFNDHTISFGLDASSNSRDVQISKQIHGFVVKCGYAYSVHVSGSLIKAYVKYGLLDDSYKLFYDPEKAGLVYMSFMISALIHQGFNIEAMELLNCMRRDGEQPDGFILSSILDGCASLASLRFAKSVHVIAIKMGLELYAPVASAMIDAYSKCGDLESAKMAFYLSSRSADVVVFNTMIMAYAHHGFPWEAMQIFQKIKAANLTPSQATFVTVLSACRHAGLVELGRNFFESISLDYNMKPSPDNYGCLVDLLSRNGFLEEANDLIQRMPFAPWPAIWRSFLHGCVIHKNGVLGEWASRELFRSFPVDDASFILCSKVCSQNSNWQDASRLRSEMFYTGVPKVAAYSRIEAM